LRERRVSRRIREFHPIADRDKLSECWPDLQNQDVRRPAEPMVVFWKMASLMRQWFANTIVDR